MNLWKEYKNALNNAIKLKEKETWATWEGKGTHLVAKT